MLIVEGVIAIQNDHFNVLGEYPYGSQLLARLKLGATSSFSVDFRQLSLNNTMEN